MTYDELKAHVMTFFGDTSRSKQETKEDLLAIAEECEMLAETLGDEDE